MKGRGLCSKCVPCCEKVDCMKQTGGESFVKLFLQVERVVVKCIVEEKMETVSATEHRDERGAYIIIFYFRI